MFMLRKKTTMPSPAEALSGRREKMPVPERHFVNGNPLEGPFPDGTARAMFGMGCFWGAERRFWELPGVYTTAAGYAAGHTPNPTYQETCSGQTGHAEVVLCVYDPALTSYEDMLKHPGLDADIPDAAEARDKIRLLKGVLQWLLERDFGDRLWRIRRDLRQTGEALVETQRARRQIDETMREEPAYFDSLNSRVYGLGPHIDALRAKVDESLARQHAFLQAVAVGELQAQKRRLDTYTVQARFALAAIYDRASTITEAAVK